MPEGGRWQHVVLEVIKEVDYDLYKDLLEDEFEFTSDIDLPYLALVAKEAWESGKEA